MRRAQETRPLARRKVSGGLGGGLTRHGLAHVLARGVGGAHGGLARLLGRQSPEEGGRVPRPQRRRGRLLHLGPGPGPDDAGAVGATGATGGLGGDEGGLLLGVLRLAARPDRQEGVDGEARRVGDGALVPAISAAAKRGGGG